MDKIKFNELSGWLKVGIVGGIISLIINGLAFGVGFIEGLFLI
jgi:hypothetical protein